MINVNFKLPVASELENHGLTAFPHKQATSNYLFVYSLFSATAPITGFGSLPQVSVDLSATPWLSLDYVNLRYY